MDKREQSKLAAYIAETYYDDPVGYCKDILQYNPDDWQNDVYNDLKVYRRVAVRSGHGVGKTRLAAGAIHWFISTRSYPRIRCTANTEKQIKSVLWSELSTVNREARNAILYKWNKTTFELVDAPEVHFAEAIAWSAENSEAFAGIHSDNVLYVYDEASAIVDIIWEVSQGAMTGSGAKWLVLGNPTRNSGKFHECFNANKWIEGDEDTSKWHCHTISCFDSPRVSQEYINEVEREYGKDSDPYRVRVLGLPPMQEVQQYISTADFDDAFHRQVITQDYQPRILGVDVAAFGDDSTAYTDRKGFKATSKGRKQKQDTMATVGDVMELRRKAEMEGDPYDYILIDIIGLGRGVYDRLVEQGVEEVIGVNVAEKPRDDSCFNLRAELWKLTKEWLKEGAIEECYRDDLTNIQFSFNSSGKLVMERKKDMKKRGLKSPDMGDSLCLTFYPLSPVRKSHRKALKKPKKQVIRKMGY